MKSLFEDQASKVVILVGIKALSECIVYVIYKGLNLQVFLVVVIVKLLCSAVSFDT